MSKFREAYERSVKEGELQPDPSQDQAVAVLERVERGLREYGGGGLGQLFHKRVESARGAYLWGGVGRGKSMLMDMFYEAAPIKAKRRVHFHAFMEEVQGRLNALREAKASRDEDVVLRVADELAESIRLLCFDELEITDIADAMIVGRLFQRLFEHGVVLVATSNERPDDLYRDGINRQLFQPFIKLIKLHTEVEELGGGRDYRRDRPQSEQRYWSPVTAQTEAAFNAAWSSETSGDVAGADITVHGRTIHFDTTTQDALRVRFEELCAADLGPDDYLAIAKRFRSVFFYLVPVLRRESADQARRFVVLIDALYEARVKLWILAEAEPDGLIQLDDEAGRRAVSRLNEMRSADWPSPP